VRRLNALAEELIKTRPISAEKLKKLKQRLIVQRAVKSAQSDDFQPDRPYTWANDTQASVLQTTPAICEAAPSPGEMARSAIFRGAFNGE
jgi:hypothetical protein